GEARARIARDLRAGRGRADQGEGEKGGDEVGASVHRNLLWLSIAVCDLMGQGDSEAATARDRAGNAPVTLHHPRSAVLRWEQWSAGSWAVSASAATGVSSGLAGRSSALCWRSCCCAPTSLSRPPGSWTSCGGSSPRRRRSRRFR